MNKDDQLVVSINLAEGVALRETAEELDISMASLARQALKLGLAALPTEVRASYLSKLEKLKKLNRIELNQLKAKFKQTRPKNKIKL